MTVPYFWISFGVLVNSGLGVEAAVIVALGCHMILLKCLRVNTLLISPAMDSRESYSLNRLDSFPRQLVSKYSGFQWVCGTVEAVLPAKFRVIVYY